MIDDKTDTLSDTEMLLASQEEELEQLMASQRAAIEREEKKKEEEANNKKNNSDHSQTKPTATKTPEDSSTNTQATGGYCWPVPSGGRISSYFGYRTAPTEGASTFHKGIDIAIPVGNSIVATKAGTVITATYSASAGNYVAISHGDGMYSYYMHCSSLSVSEGQSVSAGQQVALSGNTGISTGPHLHFAIFTGGAYVNPLNYVSQ